ncbi:MAG: heme lyase CcmF/NrfE family subunit, partial [Bryobacteraceae bacterium]
METLGAFSLLLALALAAYAFLASVIGGWKQKPFLVESARRAVYGVFILLTTASAILVSALLSSDFRYA